MSTTPDDLADLELDEPQKQGVRQRMKKLEDENKQLKEQAAKVAELERRDLFRDAGIDLSTTLGKAAFKSFEGEASIEAIKAYGIELGALQPPPPTTPADEQAAHKRVAEASAQGSTAPTIQWSEEDVRKASPKDIVAAQEAGLLNEYLGLTTQ